jgi:hypothetical protein
MGMPKYRFVIYFPEEDVEISFNWNCDDDVHACALATAAIADSNALAEVRTSSRFVGVVDAGPDLDQALATLPDAAERPEAAAERHRAFATRNLASHKRERLEAFGQRNWLLLVLAASTAIAAEFFAGEFGSVALPWP